MMNNFFRLSLLLLLSLLFSCGDGSSEKSDIPHQALEHRMEKTSFALPVRCSFRGLSVVDENVIWASGSNGTWIRTIDGGKHWAIDSLTTEDRLDLRDVEAFDANTALLMNAGFPGKIYKTSDGGKSWRTTYSNTDPAIFLNGFDFWDEKRGVAYGDPIDGRLLILTTTDGGESWQEVPAGCIPVKLEEEAGFAASGTGIVTWDHDLVIIGLGGTEARVFSATFDDKNKTDSCYRWKADTTPVISGRSGRGIYSISFGSRKNGVAVGGAWNEDSLAATKVYTNDGGHNWHLGKGEDAYRSGSCYMRNETYLATGPSGTDITYNGGRHWSRLDGEGMNAIAFDPKGVTGYAVGANGKVFSFELVRTTAE